MFFVECAEINHGIFIKGLDCDLLRLFILAYCQSLSLMDSEVKLLILLFLTEYFSLPLLISIHQ